MAIFHLSVKTISRSAGRSATAAAAYRAGVEIVDVRTGLVHDYTRRSGVLSSSITLPAGAPVWATDRSALWNAAEQSETRKNSTCAREFEVALPEELSEGQRQGLVGEFARELAERHGIAVDAAIHLPGKEGDHRNHHAHILTSTRRLGPAGFGEKARELDAKATGPALVEDWRERWAALVNDHLERAGRSDRVDHRSLSAQREAALAAGDETLAQTLDRAPTVHVGPKATAMERAQARWFSDRREQNTRTAGENTERRELAADIVTLQAERARREAVRREAEAKAARERLARMTAGEVRAEIDRLRPPPVERLLAASPAVRTAEQEATTLRRQQEEAQALLARKAREVAAWKQAHRLRARWRILDGALATLEEAVEDEHTHVSRLQPKVTVAEQALRDVREGTRAWIEREQAPVLATIVELEKVYKEKDSAERARAREQFAAEKALNSLEHFVQMRAVGSRDYGDDGATWKAMPESLQRTVEELSRVPDAKRDEVLVRFREGLQKNPRVLVELVKQIEHTQSLGRQREGPSMG